MEKFPKQNPRPQESPMREKMVPAATLEVGNIVIVNGVPKTISHIYRDQPDGGIRIKAESEYLTAGPEEELPVPDDREDAA